MAHHMASLCGCQDDALMAVIVFYFITPTQTLPHKGGGIFQVFRDYWNKAIFNAANRILKI